MKNDFNWIDDVYEIVRAIPKGKVCTYGIIAQTIGLKGSARLIGYAMNKSHFVEPKVPAHRVVNRNGMLTGKFHFENENTMQELLEKEGVEIKDDIIIDFKNKLWQP